MSEDFIRYDKLVDHAMRQVVRQALEKVLKEGINGQHHFLVSFLTNHEGVEMPLYLKEQYKNEMTIVLQHQFDDLIIKDESFSVVLSFDNVREKITIPFDALTSFADPGVKFGLKFNLIELEKEQEEEEKIKSSTDKTSVSKKSSAKGKKSVTVKNEKAKNIVSLDSLRSKRTDKKK